MEESDAVADAIWGTMESPSVKDGQGEVANIVDVIDDLAQSVRKDLAEAITARAAPGRDAAGGVVTSLTEATMGITAGLFEVATAIRELADAVRDGRSS